MHAFHLGCYQVYCRQNAKHRQAQVKHNYNTVVIVYTTTQNCSHWLISNKEIKPTVHNTSQNWLKILHWMLIPTMDGNNIRGWEGRIYV